MADSNFEEFVSETAVRRRNSPIFDPGQMFVFFADLKLETLVYCNAYFHQKWDEKRSRFRELRTSVTDR